MIWGRIPPEEFNKPERKGSQEIAISSLFEMGRAARQEKIYQR